MLRIDQSLFLLIDYQGKLAEIVYHSEELALQLEKLIKGLQLLEVPILWIEQYPKGLGPTKERISQLLSPRYSAIDKLDFGAYAEENIRKEIQASGRKNMILAGVEAHVCVYQTAKQLLREGYAVEFVQDCISSRRAEDKQIAIDKMIRLGAMPSSVEMLLFELMASSKHPKFKEVSAIIK